MRRLLVPLVALAAFAACDKGEHSPTNVGNDSPSGATQPPTVRDLPSGLAERTALPMVVLDMRLRSKTPAGEMHQRGIENAVPLQAVGLNLCQTGWVLQGFFRDRDGRLQATPPLPLPRLVAGERFEHRDPAVEGQSIVTEFSQASLENLTGTLKVLDDDVEVPSLRLDIDTRPVGIAAGKGLGALGCFTTGEWSLNVGSTDARGPAAAVWDNKLTFWLGARLDESHSVDVWLTIPPQHRQPGRVVRGDLGRVLAEPKKYPFRVVFSEGIGEGKTEVPATSGKFSASFTRANPEGPIRVEIENLEFPPWDGPLAGTTVDQFRIETLVVTDIEGSRVPIPGKQKTPPGGGAAQ